MFKMMTILAKTIVNVSPLKTCLDNRHCNQYKLFKKPKHHNFTSVFLLGFFQIQNFLSLATIPCRSGQMPKSRFVATITRSLLLSGWLFVDSDKYSGSHKQYKTVRIEYRTLGELVLFGMLFQQIGIWCEYEQVYKLSMQK